MVRKLDHKEKKEQIYQSTATGLARDNNKAISSGPSPGASTHLRRDRKTTSSSTKADLQMARGIPPAQKASTTQSGPATRLHRDHAEPSRVTTPATKMQKSSENDKPGLLSRLFNKTPKASRVPLSPEYAAALRKNSKAKKLVPTGKMFYTPEEVAIFGKRQLRYNTLTPAEREEQEEWAQHLCVRICLDGAGYRWIRQPSAAIHIARFQHPNINNRYAHTGKLGGYLCPAGGHWISDENLASMAEDLLGFWDSHWYLRCEGPLGPQPRPYPGAPDYFHVTHGHLRPVLPREAYEVDTYFLSCGTRWDTPEARRRRGEGHLKKFFDGVDAYWNKERMNSKIADQLARQYWDSCKPENWYARY